MNSYFVVKKYEVKNAKKTLFFFPAGFTKMWHYRWTVFLLNRMGISVVGFDFAWKKAIKECDFHDLVDLTSQVNATVGAVISKNLTKMQYSVLGLSFGSVFSLYMAKKQPKIQSVVLFVPYGTLSHLLWTFTPAKQFIETIMQNGVKTEKELSILTKPIETQYQLDKLKGKKIVSFLGKSDNIVTDGKELINAIKKQKIEATFYESRYGHFGTSVLGILQKKKWDNIL